MLRVNYKVTYGEYTEVQQFKDEEPREYKIKIHAANALCAMIHHYKDDNGERCAQLVNFYGDAQHLRNIMKEYSNPLTFGANSKIKGLRLNMYYKECETLLRAFTKAGYKVTAFYKEPKTK